MFTFKHSQHGTGITEEIKAAAAGHHAYNVVLVCAANEKLFAHKLVLAAASPLLKTILEDTLIPNEFITTIHFPDISAHFFRMLLNFLYSGEISMLPHEVENINNLLLLLQMCDLEKFNISISSSSDPENCITPPNEQLNQLIKDEPDPDVKLEQLDDGYIQMDFNSQEGSLDFKSLGLPLSDDALTDGENGVCGSADCDSLSPLADDILTNGENDVSDFADCDSVSLLSTDGLTNGETSVSDSADCDSVSTATKHTYKPRALKFQCTLCTKKFRSAYHLKNHVNVHLGERPYVCQLCSAKFSSKYSVFRHVCVTHLQKPESTEEEYTCSFCSLCFKTPQQMIKHLGVKHDHLCMDHSSILLINPYGRGGRNVRFLCELCKAKFTQKAHLFHHFLTKHKDKIILPATPDLYKCLFCSLLFDSRKLLHLHFSQEHHKLLLIENR